jgi:hypothetical protein
MWHLGQHTLLGIVVGLDVGGLGHHTLVDIVVGLMWGLGQDTLLGIVVGLFGGRNDARSTPSVWRMATLPKIVEEIVSGVLVVFPFYVGIEVTKTVCS